MSTISRVITFDDSKTTGMPEKFRINYFLNLPNGIPIENKLWTINLNQLDPQIIKSKKFKVWVEGGLFGVCGSEEFVVDFSQAWNGAIITQQMDLAAATEELHRDYAPLNLLKNAEELLSQHYKSAHAKYAEIWNRTKALFENLPARSVPPTTKTDFTPFYEKDLPPRYFIIKVLSKGEGLDSEETTEIKVHDMVIVANGGPIFSTFFKPQWKESREQVVTMEKTAAAVVRKAMEFLYKNTISFADDKEAREIYRFADQYFIDDLKRLAEPGSTRQDLLDADPQDISPEAFDKMLSEKTTIAEMESLSASAIEQLRQKEQLYLSNHIKRLTESS